MLRKFLVTLVTSCFIVFFSIAALARTQLDIGISLAPPPPPTSAVMAPPQGYNNCYMTPGAWMGGVWVPPHQECEYPSPTGMAMWVSGYWGCVAVGPNGACGNWRWFSHRWVRGGQVAYYGRHDGHYRHRHYW